MNNNFDLDTVLLRFSGGSQWTLRDAVCNIAAFGGIGSGKSSGVGATLARQAYLPHGFGGLILCVKDELKTWKEYCRDTGREKDLIVIEPNGPYRFDFLKFECEHKLPGVSISQNLVALIDTVLSAGREQTGSDTDRFWPAAQKMTLTAAIDLCLLAYGTVSVQLLYDIIQSAPKEGQTDAQEDNAFKRAYQAARRNVEPLAEAFIDNLPSTEKRKLVEENAIQAAIMKNVPEFRALVLADQFFAVTFKELAPKTRSTIEFAFNAFLMQLLQEPFYSLFCSGSYNVSPQDALDGKLILIHLPVKRYHQAGRDIQIALKYCFVRAWERRNTAENARPVFIWCDEAQHFVTASDAENQATSRSSLISSVFLTQNLAGIYAAMGGDKQRHRVTQLLGTFATKVFHGNADVETNKYASDLIGEDYAPEQSTGMQFGKEFSQSASQSFRLQKLVRPEAFAGLLSGGTTKKVEAYIHRQGLPFANGRNYRKIRFTQPSKKSHS